MLTYSLTSSVSARLAQFPTLPPRRPMASQSEKFAERRRKELEAYLTALLREQELRSCNEIHSFLELGFLLGRAAQP